MAFRKTKIVCTIGPACWEIPQLETLMETGMNVARLNFSHGEHEGHGKTLDRIRQAARNKSRNIAILLDTKGPEIRSGFFANDVKKVDLIKGETIVLTTVSMMTFASRASIKSSLYSILSSTSTARIITLKVIQQSSRAITLICPSL